MRVALVGIKLRRIAKVLKIGARFALISLWTRKNGLGTLAVAIILISASIHLSWSYLVAEPYQKRSVDKLHFEVHFPEDGGKGSGSQEFVIDQNVEASWERVNFYLATKDSRGASVDVSLSPGDHPGPEWYCASGEPMHESEISFDWKSVRSGDAKGIPLRKEDSGALDLDDIPPGRTYGVLPWPHMSCHRIGSGLENYGQGRITVAPADFSVNSNLAVDARWTIERDVLIPSSWDPVTFESYSHTIQVSGGTRGIRARDPDTNSRAASREVLQFIDREAERAAEVRAWIGALVAGFGAGLIPIGAERLTHPSQSSKYSSRTRGTVRRIVD